MLKVSEKREFAAQLNDLLAGKRELRPFPVAVTQLLAACQAQDVSAGDFERVIQTDPGLSLRVLRMANSPLAGLPRKVETISHAVALLGVRQIRSMALAVAGAKMFSGGRTQRRYRRQLWKHSLGCAIIARELSSRYDEVDSEDAFLAGVFHDVGKLLFLDTVPDVYVDMAGRLSGDQLSSEEQFTFDVNHGEIGLKCALGWSLSEPVKMAIGFHHRPEEAPCHDSVVTLVAAANSLSHHWMVGCREQSESELAMTHLDRLGIDEENAVDVRERVMSCFDDTLQAVSA